MKEAYKLIKDIIAKLGYKVLDDDGESITVYYQLNIVHIIPDGQDDDFVTVVATVAHEVTRDNRVEVLERCNKLNNDLKVMKYCVFDEEIYASSEFFFRNKNEVKHQLAMALNQLAIAKSLYNKTRV